MLLGGVDHSFNVLDLDVLGLARGTQDEAPAVADGVARAMHMLACIEDIALRAGAGQFVADGAFTCILKRLLDSFGAKVSEAQR